jgi:hypothetical protein
VFGTNPTTKQGSFVDAVQAGSGLLRLTVLTPP